MVIALDDVSLQVRNPYLQPTVKNVSLADNGGVNITWSHAGCSQTLSFTTMVYYRTSSSSEWTLDATTDDSSHVINSILFPPNAVFQFKVNTRYVVNYQVIISDDSVAFNFTIPDPFISSTLPPVPSDSDRGWLLNRGTITCEVISVIKPTIILKKDQIIYPAEQLAELTNTTSGGTNLWHVPTSISQFEDRDAAKYICEIKFGTDIVQSRILYLNIQGSFKYVQHNESSN